MAFVSDLLISLFLIVSGVFGFVGSYGLIKLKNPIQRLHAPTKATTLGVGAVLIASVLYFVLKTGHISFHEVLISVFLFLTAPTTANFIAKAYMAESLKQDSLPKTANDRGWSLYDAPPTGDGKS